MGARRDFCQEQLFGLSGLIVRLRNKWKLKAKPDKECERRENNSAFGEKQQESLGQIEDLLA
jgi:hypothetical protein